LNAAVSVVRRMSAGNEFHAVGPMYLCDPILMISGRLLHHKLCDTPVTVLTLLNVMPVSLFTTESVMAFSMIINVTIFRQNELCCTRKL